MLETGARREFLAYGVRGFAPIDLEYVVIAVYLTPRITGDWTALQGFRGELDLAVLPGD